MTFDDGIVTIYEAKLVSEKGMQPKRQLVQKSRHFFSFETVGYNRFYEALKANEQIENMISIPVDRSIKIHDMAKLEDGIIYTISLVQHYKDDDGLYCTRLTLGHYNEQFEFQA